VLAFSAILVDLAAVSPSTAAVFRCAYAAARRRFLDATLDTPLICL
jgi:O-antigen ligase